MLPGRHEPVAQLGFGTAALGRRLTRRQKERLLDEAFALGISYFDTAPLYGHGQAEEAVGRFAARRRDEIAVATKLGFEWSGRIRRRAVRRFDVPAARRQLDASLLSLRTDGVDVLLLHEPQPADVDPALFAFLHDVVAAGEAGAVGVAGAARDVAALAGGLAVGQTSVAELDALPPGLFRIGYAPLAPLRDGSQPSATPRELLADAMDRHPDAIVLLGTSSREHLRQNVAGV